MKERYQSTKTYGHDLGLSCCFRQHKAQSHCKKLHGYSLGFKFTFEAEHLDERGWVQDFGALKGLKQALEQAFDHTLVVSMHDPELLAFQQLMRSGVCDLVILHAVGVEAFAKHAYQLAADLLNAGSLDRHDAGNRVRVVSCECSEHGANSAIYYGPAPINGALPT
jgi:6-pyruvoyltetrahydropterin/6-carboxytetrahydropterin synthase